MARAPREASADAGFCRESNLDALAARGIRGYLSPGRASHGSADPSGPAAAQARVADGGDGGEAEARRPALALSPAQADGRAVIGQIKHARGFRQFLLRGFSKAKAEWALICTAHNLTKLLAARTA